MRLLIRISPAIPRSMSMSSTVWRNSLNACANRLPTVPQPDFQYAEGGLNYVTVKRFTESLGEHTHDVLVNPELPPVQPAVPFTVEHTVEQVPQCSASLFRLISQPSS